MQLCLLLTVIVTNYNSGGVSSRCKKDTRVGRECKKDEGLILILWSAIVGNDNSGALVRRSGGTTAARGEYQCHCYCCVVRGCCMGTLKKHDLCMYVKWVYVNCQIRDNQSWLAYHTP